MIRDMEDSDAAFFDLRDVRSIVAKWAIDCGRKVTERRESLGLDRRKFAAMVGTTEATITRVEQGVLNPRDHLKLAIAAALALEVEDLWRHPRRTEVFAGASLAGTS